MKQSMNKIEPTELTQKILRPLSTRMTDEELDGLVNVLPMHQVHVEATPVTGLIMAKVRDCFDTDFYLGEVLVTRAEVRYADCRAQATVMGRDPKKAIVAAVLEAIAMSGQTDLLENALRACQPAMDRFRSEGVTVSRFTAATRVHFESMAEEV
jgi:phosphonate C-P lyase system protein PhnG